MCICPVIRIYGLIQSETIGIDIVLNKFSVPYSRCVNLVLIHVWIFFYLFCEYRGILLHKAKQTTTTIQYDENKRGTRLLSKKEKTHFLCSIIIHCHFSNFNH